MSSSEEETTQTFQLDEQSLSELLESDSEGLIAEVDFSMDEDSEFQQLWNNLNLTADQREKYNLAFFFTEIADCNENDLQWLSTAPNPYKHIKNPIDGKVAIFLLLNTTCKKMYAVNYSLQGFQHNEGEKFGKFNRKGYKYKGLAVKYDLV